MIEVRKIAAMMAKLKKECVHAYSINEAYESGHGFHHANHGVYIVPTELMLRELGIKEGFLPRGIGKVLRQMGWSRNTRVLYEKSSRRKAISCWVYEEK